MKMFKGQIEWKDSYRLIDFIYWFSVYDVNDNEIYFESDSGFWYKREYDENCNEIYFKDSKGFIVDSRPKKKVTIELTKEQLNKIKGSGLL